ncbi:cis-prenyltransferase [Xylographa parallela]|nr:cis-prenyltransferase [Xylographa parallela]
MPSMHLSQIRKWFLQSPPVEWAIYQLRELLIGALRQGPVPQHVAFVMDGNRRFARSHMIETVEGHNLGFEALARILEVCYKSGVKVVTIYAFSIENFKRSRFEVDALMNLAKLKLDQLSQHGELLQRYGASIRILGQRELVKPDVLEAIDKAMELTKGNGDAILNVCFPYTSREEITTAVRGCVEDWLKPVVVDLAALQEKQRAFSETHITHTLRSRHLSADAARIRAHSPSSAENSDLEGSLTTSSSATTLQPSTPSEMFLPGTEGGKSHKGHEYPNPERITQATLDEHMFTAGMPPLELLIRTSGVERLSDFMLWQSHQNTEVVFLDCLWPEFDLWTFLPVLVEWQWRRRKEGEGKGDRLLASSSSRKTR